MTGLGLLPKHSFRTTHAPEPLLPWALLGRKSRGPRRWGESDSLVKNCKVWIIAGLGCCLLIYKESCLWLSCACLEGMRGKIWLQTFQGLCMVHDRYLSLRALLLLFLVHSPPPPPPPLLLSCIVYQITLVCKLKMLEQMIPSSFFHFSYVWEIEDTLRTKFARNFG